MTNPGIAAPRRGLAAEIKDAVTVRAVLLVCGVGLLQLAFVVLGNPSVGGACAAPLLPGF